MNPKNLFSNKPKYYFIILGTALTVSVGLFDYLTGNLPFSIFYLIPICFITWNTGFLTGILTSFACALIYFFNLYTDVRTFENSFFIYWNAAVTFGFYIVVVLILAKMKSALERARIYARADYLTKAFNYRAFRELLENEIMRSRRYDRHMTVAYLDLDNFKQVNDDLGHSAGDQLLNQVAKILIHNLRRKDTVARIGGGEFAIILPETTKEQAEIAIDKVHGSLLEIMRIREWPLTFSIGVATFVRPPSSVDELLLSADTVMYSAKNDGNNKVKYAVIEEGAKLVS